MTKISVIIPVVRTGKVNALIDLINQNAGLPKDQYEIVWEEDVNRIGAPKMVNMLAEKAKYDLVCFLGDDTQPEKDFLIEALKEMLKCPDGWGVVGLNTTQNDHAHWLAHKNILRYTDNMFFNEEYYHAYCDDELKDVAVSLGRWRVAEKSIVNHDHPLHNTANWDDFYELAYMPDRQKADLRTYWKRKRARANKIVLGIAEPSTNDKVHHAYHRTFTEMIKRDFKFLFPKIPSYDFPRDIGIVRNYLVMKALYEGCTHLLFCDTDQTYPPDTIERLLGSGKDIIGSLIFKRYPPFHPTLMRGEIGKSYHVPYKEWKDGGIINVDSTGTGCLLVNTKVFLEMDDPWFKLDEIDGKSIGEDIYFCHKAKKLGYDIFVDASVNVGHLATFEINREMHELFNNLGG